MGQARGACRFRVARSKACQMMRDLQQLDDLNERNLLAAPNIAGPD